MHITTELWLFNIRSDIKTTTAQWLYAEPWYSGYKSSIRPFNLNQGGVSAEIMAKGIPILVVFLFANCRISLDVACPLKSFVC